MDETKTPAPSGPSTSKTPKVWHWVLCDLCNKSRRLPDNIDPESLPEKWYCRFNPDVTHNRCDVPEESEDEDEAIKSTKLLKKRNGHLKKRAAEGVKSMVKLKNKKPCVSKTQPRRDQTTAVQTRRRSGPLKVSSIFTSPSRESSKQIENDDNSLIDLTGDNETFEVPASIIIKSDPDTDGTSVAHNVFSEKVLRHSAAKSSNQHSSNLEANQGLTNIDESSDNSSLFLVWASKSSAQNMNSKSTNEGPSKNVFHENNNKMLNGEGIMTDAGEEMITEEIRDIEVDENDVEDLQHNFGSLHALNSSSENDITDQSIQEFSEPNCNVGDSIDTANKNSLEIYENNVNNQMGAQKLSNFENIIPSLRNQKEKDATDFQIEIIDSLKSTLAETVETLRKLRRNVYLLLRYLAPDRNLGAEENIDNLLEDMLRNKEEEMSQSQLQSDESEG
ncbi:MORC family CW-type zinc finger protein 3 [Elysia marginata]|uniref:MORC family CW-type zinc finger protein 3 n=1 Tax=Elysia marginata TaxID=1093978 RepID=A0AAV4JHV1_9GAST|nr:MORC family CW-type zinc finger protein 3 [Elysia marginata]